MDSLRLRYFYSDRVCLRELFADMVVFVNVDSQYLKIAVLHNHSTLFHVSKKVNFQIYNASKVFEIT